MHCYVKTLASLTGAEYYFNSCAERQTNILRSYQPLHSVPESFEQLSAVWDDPCRPTEHSQHLTALQPAWN